MAGQSISKGALVLTTDAAQLQAGLKSVQGQIQSFSNRVTTLLGAQLSFGALSGFAEQIKSIGDESENFLNLAEVFEISAEKMQALAAATNLAGIETESLVKAMRIAAEKFPGEADPVSALFKALQQLRDIPDVNERIKQAGELFGGKNSIEVLKIMKADLPAVTAELRQHAVLLEDQLKLWDKMGDAVSLFFTKTKNLGKGLVGDIAKLMEEPNDSLPLSQKLFLAHQNFKQHVASLERLGFSPSEANELTKRSSIYREWVQISEQFTQKMNENTAAQERRNESIKQAKLLSEFQVEQAGKMQALEEATKNIDQFMKPDAIVEFTKAFEDMNFLFNERRLTVDEYTHAIANLKKALEATGSAAEDVHLPGAATRGSVEDVSASIRASVGKENTRSAETNRLLGEIKQELQKLGVE